MRSIEEYEREGREYRELAEKERRQRLTATVKQVLAAHDAFCLDVPDEVQTLTRALVDALLKVT